MLPGKMYFSFNPQMSYLKLDDNDGFYVTAATTIGLENFPITISGIVNQAIESTIPAQDFDWSVSLIYTLEKHFIKNKVDTEHETVGA